MNIVEYFTRAYQNFAKFDGRDTRQEFWMFILAYFIVSIVLTIIDTVSGMIIGGENGLGVLSTLFGLATFIPSISIATRRLHDIGKSGWWQLIVLVPFVGFIVLIIFYCLPSEGDNKYGPARQ